MYRYVKRGLDAFFAGLAVVILTPFMIPVVIALKLTGEGEVFYRQERVGLGGCTFQLLKFATMLKDSPRIGAGEITLENDPRIRTDTVMHQLHAELLVRQFMFASRNPATTRPVAPPTTREAAVPPSPR